MSSLSLGSGRPSGPVAPTAPARPRLGPTVLVVGYPAPAAVRIVDRLLATDTRTIAGVVARERWAEATRQHPAAQDAGRLRLYQGSAAVPGLGLAHTAWRLLDTAEEIYGVASSHEIATGHLRDFADECPHLREVHLVALDTDENGTSSASAAPSALRRGLRSVRVPARLRASVGTIAAVLARGVVGVGRVGAVARAARPWKDVMNLDVEAALSWEDIESDLWPREAT